MTKHNLLQNVLVNLRDKKYCTDKNKAPKKPQIKYSLKIPSQYTNRIFDRIRPNLEQIRPNSDSGPNQIPNSVFEFHRNFGLKLDLYPNQISKTRIRPSLLTTSSHKWIYKSKT